MLVPILLLIVGLVMLIKGGDWFVDGATGIARRFHLPEILIGATVVSIGTTLPEVMVSAGSALSGNGSIAYGNAIGSIICNASLIAALTIAIKPGKADRKSMIIPVSFFCLAAAIYCSVAYIFRDFSLIVGIILLCTFVVYMVLTVVSMFKSGSSNEIDEHDVEDDGKKGSLVKDIFLLILGAVLIKFGADFLVDNATIIAKALNMSETVIGLTIVAIGTSLPELVTAITALAKGHGALSLGNIIGANLFNLVLVSGASITLCPFPLPSDNYLGTYNSSLVLDIPVMLSVMFILVAPTMIKQKLSRWQGILMLCIYATWMVISVGFVKTGLGA